MAIIIRRAEEKDIPFIYELLGYIREVHYKGRPDVFKSSGAKYSADELKEKLKNKDEAVFVAYDGSNPLGYVCAQLKITKDNSVLIDKKTLYIDDLCVYEKCHNRGVGRMLIDAAKDYAKSISCNSMELNVWKFDGSAEGFYRSYGFCTMSRRMEYKLD